MSTPPTANQVLGAALVLLSVGADLAGLGVTERVGGVAGEIGVYGVIATTALLVSFTLLERAGRHVFDVWTHGHLDLSDALLAAWVIFATLAVSSLPSTPLPATAALITCCGLTVLAAAARKSIRGLDYDAAHLDKNGAAWPFEEFRTPTTVVVGALIVLATIQLAPGQPRDDADVATSDGPETSTSVVSPRPSPTLREGAPVPTTEAVTPEVGWNTQDPGVNDPTSSCPFGPGDGASSVVAENMVEASEARASREWGCVGEAQPIGSGSFVQPFAHSIAVVVGSDVGAGVIAEAALPVLQEFGAGSFSFDALGGQVLNMIHCESRTADFQPVVDASGVIVLLLGRPEKREPAANPEVPGEYVAARPSAVQAEILPALAEAMRSHDVPLYPLGESSTNNDGIERQTFGTRDRELVLELKATDAETPEWFTASFLFTVCGGDGPVPNYLEVGG